MSKKIGTVGVNSFATRQTSESRFSHYAGTLAAVAAMAEANLASAKSGYKDGVLLVSVPAEGFFSGVVKLTPETALKATFEARREGEDAFLQVVALGAQKAPANFVEVVLYRHDILGEGEASTDAEYELVSINARATEGDEPMHPIAMMRNQLGLAGGTKAEYTSDQWAEATRYWATRVMAG